ncbi:MAG TPA: arginine--tRNA ligase [Acidimicrobiales bacterium]|nr:arginine--tRNA ligase [Acidimicrobiales bacterium]
MPDPVHILTERLQGAIGAAFGPELAGADPVLRRAGQARFGDYQANAAMALSKRLGRPGRDVADAILAHLDGRGVVAKAEVAGGGFINLTLDDTYLARETEASAASPTFGVARTAAPRRFVVDFAGPNVAKEMHVGHLRSCAIGDALARILEFLGHRVMRQDHLGDWGRQFGMLIEHLVDLGWDTADAGSGAPRSISDLNELYRQAQEKLDSDPAFADRSRTRVVALQSGDARSMALWKELVAESRRHFEEVYRRLGVTLRPEDVRPESFYNETLGPMVAELEHKGLVAVDQGALCAFPEGFTGRDGGPLPLIVRNSFGGYGYAATDLAGVRFSVRDLGADRLVYVTDARQAQHFAMVFAVAGQAGWLGERAAAEHAPFGTILGPDNKPFKTRSGDTIRLADLLDEAVERARAVVVEKSPDLDADAAAAVAEAVGIGSVKYNDLANDRVKDYVFDWDRMLAREGNTAPYLQYAHARIHSIFRRGSEMEMAQEPAHAGDIHLVLAEPQERALALALVGFDGAVHATATHLQPHRLCTYLFELATTFTTFYEACPVLRADPEVRESRLGLSALTAAVLGRGLDLLGIAAPQRM